MIWVRYLLLLAVVLVLARFLVLKHTYERVTGHSVRTYHAEGISYQVWGGDPRQPVILHVGDLLGTNIRSAQFLRGLIHPPAGPTHIILPSLNPTHLDKVTLDSFLQSIGNERGVIVVDNFCSTNWEAVKSHAWYRQTGLSPGPYCFSEPRARLVDRLIKQHRVSMVRIYSDHPTYVRLISNFLNYLANQKIAHDVIPLQ